MDRHALKTGVRWLVAGLALCSGQMARGQNGDAPAMAMGSGGRMVQGTVTAVAPDRVTVKTAQGEMYQVTASANTRVTRGRDPIKFSEVHVEDGVGAMGEIDPATKTVHALFVTVVTAEDLKKAKEALGKTVIVGTVTAIDDLKLTIKRPDGVEQVIAVDEDTSFRRGGRNMQALTAAYNGMGGGNAAGRGGGQRAGGAGASGAAGDEGEIVTLAEVKVGSMVAGKGALKNGIFVPTQLGVADPGAGRQRRQREGGAGAAAGAPAASPATPAAAPPSLEPR